MNASEHIFTLRDRIYITRLVEKQADKQGNPRSLRLHHPHTTCRIARVQFKPTASPLRSPATCSTCRSESSPLDPTVENVSPVLTKPAPLTGHLHARAHNRPPTSTDRWSSTWHTTCWYWRQSTSCSPARTQSCSRCRTATRWPAARSRSRGDVAVANY